jgi:toxin YoeB
MRNIIFHSQAFEEYSNWAKDNIKTFERLRKLISESAKTPFDGTGKPEPLKHQHKGYWSRRITDEHRLVYKVTDEAIIIIACKHHY